MVTWVQDCGCGGIDTWSHEYKTADVAGGRWSHGSRTAEVAKGTCPHGCTIVIVLARSGLWVQDSCSALGRFPHYAAGAVAWQLAHHPSLQNKDVLLGI